MNTSLISSAARLSITPAKLAGRAAGRLLRNVRGGRAEAPAAPPASPKPAGRATTRARATGRTDTPARQRKTRRTPKRPQDQTATPGKLTEEAPAPEVAEPAPNKVAAGGKGRAPAPLGSRGSGGPNT
jgi:hypothetical protein